MVLLVACFKDSKQFLIIGGLAEGPHDGSREEEADKIVEVKTRRVVVEDEEEHDRHEEHHPLHHLHLFGLLAYHLVALLTHSHPRVEQVGYAEKYTGEREVVTYDGQIGAPFEDGVIG